MFQVEEFIGTEENPDVRDQINNFLEQLEQVDGKIDVFDIKYSRVPLPIVSDDGDIYYKAIATALLIYHIE